MKILLFTFSMIIFSVMHSHAQEILLKGDNTSMVNLYGDAKLLSTELTKNPKTQAKSYIGKGFKVLAYYGTEKGTAEKTQSALSKKYPKHKPSLQFDAPTYWVKLGNFSERKDAEIFLESINSLYPNAAVVPDQIIINAQ